MVRDSSPITKAAESAELDAFPAQEATQEATPSPPLNGTQLSDASRQLNATQLSDATVASSTYTGPPPARLLAGGEVAYAGGRGRVTTPFGGAGPFGGRSRVTSAGRVVPASDDAPLAHPDATWRPPPARKKSLEVSDDVRSSLQAARPAPQFMAEIERLPSKLPMY